MTTFIAMLRGINVGGRNKIKMAALRSLCESLGFTNVKTYLQSGNVVFESEESSAETLAARIREAIQAEFGFEILIFMQLAHDFERVVANNPFLGRSEDLTKLHVTFLQETPEAHKWEKLADIKTGVDEYERGKNEIFLFCPNGYGRTKLTNNAIERKLGVSATTRNWKTVMALHQMATSA